MFSIHFHPGLKTFAEDRTRSKAKVKAEPAAADPLPTAPAGAHPALDPGVPLLDVGKREANLTSESNTSAGGAVQQEEGDPDKRQEATVAAGVVEAKPDEADGRKQEAAASHTTAKVSAQVAGTTVATQEVKQHVPAAKKETLPGTVKTKVEPAERNATRQTTKQKKAKAQPIEEKAPNTVRPTNCKFEHPIKAEIAKAGDT